MTGQEAFHRWMLTYGIGAVAAAAIVVAIVVLVISIFSRRRD